MSEFKDFSKEEIIYEAKLHWISYILPWALILVGGVFIIPLFFVNGYARFISFILSLLFLVGTIDLLRKKSIKISLSSNYLSISKGILGKQTVDISLKKFEGMVLKQSLIGRGLNFGTLTVTTGEVVYSYNIKKPQELRGLIMKH